MKYGPTLFCLCVMLGLSADAQPRSSDQWALSQWQKRVWQIEDGLPHNYVTSVSQDGKGRLLIATKCGIVTFDGFQFAPYPLLKEMPVYSVLQASDGVLWAGTYRQGLYRIQNGRATKIENGTFFSLTETKDGRVWAVSDIGAGYIEKDHFRITVTGAYTGVYGQPTSQDEDGSLWLAAKSGIFHYRGNRIQAMQVRKLDGLPVTVYSVPVSHELFLGTTKKLYRLVCNRSSCVGSAVEGVQGPIVGLHQAFDQTLWIATWGHGLYRLSRINGKNKLENVDSRSGLADGFVRTLYEDNEHDMWVGTRGSGLTRFRTTILKPFGMSEGIDGNCASSAIGDGEGGVWLGTWRSGLFHWSNGKMEQQALPPGIAWIFLSMLSHWIQNEIFGLVLRVASSSCDMGKRRRRFFLNQQGQFARSYSPVIVASGSSIPKATFLSTRREIHRRRDRSRFLMGKAWPTFCRMLPELCGLEQETVYGKRRMLGPIP